MSYWQQVLRDIHEQGWSYRTDILSLEQVRQINQFINRERLNFKAALVGKGIGRKRIEEIRGDFTYWLDPLNPPVVISEIMENLNSFKNELNRQFYLGLKEYECHLAYYPVGTHYNKHLDRFEMESSRTISFVFYLNEDWSEQDGGELVLYKKNGEILANCLPTAGSFACFLSGDFPHEVKTAGKERRSLTGWMHTKIIY
jgi:SM-20-related protein